MPALTIATSVSLSANSPRASLTEATLAAYRLYAAKTIASWERQRRPSRLLQAFARLLPAGGRVLDYGCGIGTDLAWLSRRGFRVEGIDGTPDFVREARRRCPQAQVAQARFEDAALPPAAYDGIWCQAALMHVPPEVLVHELRKLRAALRPDGLLGLTLAWGRAKRILTRDWIPGRYVAAYAKAEAAALFAEWRLRRLGVATHDGRQGRWVHILAHSR